jgi:hypothetical protein
MVVRERDLTKFFRFVKTCDCLRGMDYVPETGLPDTDSDSLGELRRKLDQMPNPVEKLQFHELFYPPGEQQRHEPAPALI